MNLKIKEQRPIGIIQQVLERPKEFGAAFAAGSIISASETANITDDPLKVLAGGATGGAVSALLYAKTEKPQFLAGVRLSIFTVMLTKTLGKDPELTAGAATMIESTLVGLFFAKKKKIAEKTNAEPSQNKSWTKEFLNDAKENIKAIYNPRSMPVKHMYIMTAVGLGIISADGFQNLMNMPENLEILPVIKESLKAVGVGSVSLTHLFAALKNPSDNIKNYLDNPNRLAMDSSSISAVSLGLADQVEAFAGVFSNWLNRQTKTTEHDR